jgi:hypothetical protein
LRKVGFILFLTVVCAGCSVLKKEGKTVPGTDSGAVSGSITERVESQNISKSGFFIQKAEITYSTDVSREEFIATVKFQPDKKLLISIRSKAGIEAARVLLSGDSILINDRINRKFYFGSESSAVSKYGISASLLPLVFGDFILSGSGGMLSDNCIEGKQEKRGVIEGMKVNYSIDCKRGKTVMTVLDRGSRSGRIEIKYSEFIKAGDVLTAGRIEIFQSNSNTKIEIRIKKIEIPFNGVIEFIPGNRYEKIELL